jgi:nucleoside-diphosphate-sugar epimerase
MQAEGSFDVAFEGCSYVMHTASPFQITVADPQRDLLDPALKGTLNVLQAAKKGSVCHTPRHTRRVNTHEYVHFSSSIH